MSWSKKRRKKSEGALRVRFGNDCVSSAVAAGAPQASRQEFNVDRCYLIPRLLAHQREEKKKREKESEQTLKQHRRTEDLPGRQGTFLHLSSRDKSPLPERNVNTAPPQKSI